MRIPLRPHPQLHGNCIIIPLSPLVGNKLPAPMTGRRRRRPGTFIYARDREEETTSSGLQRAGPSANNLILLVFLVTGQRPSARRTSDNNKKKKTNAKGNIRPSTFCRGYFRTPSNTQTHARVGQIITRADTSRLDCNTHRRKSARGSLLCH